MISPSTRSRSALRRRSENQRKIEDEDAGLPAVALATILRLARVSPRNQHAG